METSTMRHLRLAAEGGDAAAQFNLGVLYDSRVDDNGYAVDGNRPQALKWLLAAAEQGLPRAQNRLAQLYAGGRGTAANQVKACAWFLLASTSSHGVHRQHARSGFERIASHLSPAQLLKAKRLAGLWRAADPNQVAAAAPPSSQ